MVNKLHPYFHKDEWSQDLMFNEFLQVNFAVFDILKCVQDQHHEEY